MNGDFDEELIHFHEDKKEFTDNLKTGEAVFFMPSGSVENKVEFLAHVIDTLVDGGLNEDSDKPQPHRPPKPPQAPYSNVRRFIGETHNMHEISSLSVIFCDGKEPIEGRSDFEGKIVTLSMKIINPRILHNNEVVTEAFFQLRNISLGVAATQHVKIMHDTVVKYGDNCSCEAININLTFNVGRNPPPMNPSGMPDMRTDDQIIVYFFDDKLVNTLDVTFDSIEYYGYTVN